MDPDAAVREHHGRLLIITVVLFYYSFIIGCVLSMRGIAEMRGVDMIRFAIVGFFVPCVVTYIVCIRRHMAMQQQRQQAWRNR